MLVSPASAQTAASASSSSRSVTKWLIASSSAIRTGGRPPAAITSIDGDVDDVASVGDDQQIAVVHQRADRRETLVAGCVTRFTARSAFR